MAASETDIVNEALARIGVSPIMALSDDSRQAQFGKRFYDQSRDEVLAVRAWPFAIQRTILNSLTVAPVSEWQYAYQLPVDYIRLVQLNNDEVGNIKHKYAIEGKTLVTDAPVVSICYVGRIADVSFFSPIFVESLVLKLASKLAAPLTGAVEMGVQFLQIYEKAVMAPEVGEQSGRTKRQKDQTTTPTEIANTALGMIGAPPITSFSDASVQAQIADRLYDQTRDEVMSERAWTFAVKRATLVQTANPGGSEYAFSYALPADHLRLMQLNDDEIDVIQNKYTLEAGNLLTDATSAKIVYVGRITDSTKYSPLFIEALTLKLAIKMFNALTDGKNINGLKALMTGYEKAMATPQPGEQRNRAKRNKNNTITEPNIANMALALLGVAPIVSLGDNSVQAQLADRLFDQTRDEVLMAHRWNFAIKRGVIAETTVPLSGYLHAYTLPADHLRLLQLNGYEVDEIQDAYELEGNTLLTDHGIPDDPPPAPPAPPTHTVDIRYVARITDPTKYPPLFLEALSLKLASKLAGPLTQDRNVSLQMLENYERIVIPKGRLTNAFQNRPRLRLQLVESKFVRSRRSGW